MKSKARKVTDRRHHFRQVQSGIVPVRKHLMHYWGRKVKSGVTPVRQHQMRYAAAKKILMSGSLQNRWAEQSAIIPKSEPKLKEGEKWGVMIEFTQDDIDRDTVHPKDWSTDGATAGGDVFGGSAASPRVLSLSYDVSKDSDNRYSGWAIFDVVYDFQSKDEAEEFYTQNLKGSRNIQFGISKVNRRFKVLRDEKY